MCYYSIREVSIDPDFLRLSFFLRRVVESALTRDAPMVRNGILILRHQQEADSYHLGRLFGNLTIQSRIAK